MFLVPMLIKPRQSAWLWFLLNRANFGNQVLRKSLVTAGIEPRPFQSQPDHTNHWTITTKAQNRGGHRLYDNLSILVWHKWKWSKLSLWPSEKWIFTWRRFIFTKQWHETQNEGKVTDRVDEILTFINIELIRSQATMSRSQLETLETGG